MLLRDLQRIDSWQVTTSLKTDKYDSINIFSHKIVLRELQKIDPFQVITSLEPKGYYCLNIFGHKISLREVQEIYCLNFVWSKVQAKFKKRFSVPHQV